jgi:hypothetical protein
MVSGGGRLDTGGERTRRGVEDRLSVRISRVRKTENKNDFVGAAKTDRLF